nr:MAG: RNA-dependent RNA polymerase [Botourmiaviridae sp.]
MHGTPTAERVAKVCKGSIQTSVDLVNATDGLRLDVTEAILGALLAKTVAVPGAVKELAFASLYPNTNFSKGHQVTHGQMMGTYLSFPLLCLHSYCAASWAGRKSLVKGRLVNGDDVIISHDLPLGDYPDGYQKNEAKTITSPKTCELNSTVFLASRDGWREVRNLRRVGAEVDFRGIRHMADACQRAGPRWVSAFIRSCVGKRWGMSPKDLGLSTRHRLVWLRELRARGKMSDVKIPVPLADPRYLIVDREPSPIEKVEFGIDLFNEGRSVALPIDFNPSRNAVLKTQGPRIPRRTSGSRDFGSFLSHSTHLFYDSLESSKRKVWLVVQPTDDSDPDYESTSCLVGEETYDGEVFSRGGAYVLAPNSVRPAPSNYLREYFSQKLGGERIVWE